MSGLAEFTHKTLLPLGNQAIISRIIQQFGPDWDYVVAVGYRSNLIRDYMAVAHPDYRVTFIEVSNYDGPGSGPGLSLSTCRSELERPFVLTASDTLIRGWLPAFDSNWIGVLPVKDPSKWCSAVVNANGMVEKLYYKTAAPTDLAFTGLAHIKDWRDFWTGLEQNRSLLRGESQVNGGLEALISDGLFAHVLDWVDTGTLENYRAAQRNFEPNYSFEGKNTDITYRLGGRVVKYFPSEESARVRFERGASNIGAFVPVRERRGNFYSCDFIQGELLSAGFSGRRCRTFLEWAWKELWRPCTVDGGADEVRRVQAQFYRVKTETRLHAFLDKFLPGGEETVEILGVACRPALEMVRCIEDSFYLEGAPSTFHGDLHGDNILVTNDGYRLIDWREGFGDQSRWGDLYYDLAKFYHTIQFSVRTMADGAFESRREGKNIFLSHDMDFGLFDAADAFWRFVREKELDERRIRILNSLVFLNMAPLYEEKLATYLYYLGRYELQKEVR